MLPIEAARQVLRKGWEAIIAKPAWHHEAYCGFGASGITKVLVSTAEGKLRAEAEVAAELQAIADKCPNAGHADFTLQQYIPAISANYEVRSYWIGGAYSHSAATLSRTEQVCG